MTEYLLYSAIGTTSFFAAVLLIRFLLRSRPASELLSIWYLCIVRMFIPVSVILDASILPAKVYKGIGTIQGMHMVTVEKSREAVQASGASAETFAISPELILVLIWVVGAVVFAINYVYRTRLLRIKTQKSRDLSSDGKIRKWSDNTGACVIGIIKPSIYLPYESDSRYSELILAHEEQHIKHHDGLIVLLLYTGLAVNWFNPLAWVIYKIACQDIESACDERVLKGSSVETRKDYARALLFASSDDMQRKMTMGFGSKNIRKRIIRIGEKKNSKTVYAVLIAVVIALFAVFSGIVITNNRVQVDIADDEIFVAPDFLYADQEKCIFSDYHGIFVYDLKHQKFTDFIDSREAGFNRHINGEDAFYTFTCENGKKIYITYMASSTRKKAYIYDTRNHKGRLGEYKADGIKNIDEPDFADSGKFDITNQIGDIIKNGKDSYIYWHFKGQGEKYKDLELVNINNGNKEVMKTF